MIGILRLRILLIYLCLMGIAAGCSALSRDKQEAVYLPPTRAIAAFPPIIQATATPIPEQAPTQAVTSTINPPCTDNLLYLEDQTIPDGSLVSAGEVLDKRWFVENNGSCNWGKDYRLKLISGFDLGALPEQGLYPARSGTQAAIRIVFTAPAEPGVYRSAWQASNPAGQPFGDPIYIEVQVASD